MTISPSEKELTCRTCLNTEKWHEENKPMHPFNTGEAGVKAFLRPIRDRGTPEGPQGVQRGAQRPAWPMDPVLRQALINKGVLTPEDLRDAEEYIRAVTGQFEKTVTRSRSE